MFKQLSILGSSNRMENRKVLQVDQLSLKLPRQILLEVSTLGCIVAGYEELPHGCVRISTRDKGLYMYTIFNMYEHFFLHICVCPTCLPGDLGIQRSMLDPLKLWL